MQCFLPQVFVLTLLSIFFPSRLPISVFFWPWSHESEVWVYLIPKVIYPLNNMTFCCSIYLTVMLAWERYLAVCHPNHYRTVNTVQAGYTRILLIHVLPVVLFSVILNVPKFLETEFFYEHR
jgi:hypothetical protein